MAITTGSAPNVLSLIDAIRVFAVANGWTNNLYATEGAGKRLHISKNGIFANFRACVNENPNVYPTVTDVEGAGNYYALWLNLSTAFDENLAWYKQPNAPYYLNNPQDVNSKIYEYAGINSLSGAMNYFLFSFDNSFIGVVETPAGYFHWFGFGNLAGKVGDWTGGEYFFAKHTPSEGNNGQKSFPLFGSDFGGQGSQRSYCRIAAGIDAGNGWIRGRGTASISGNIRGERLFDSVQRQNQLWELTPNLVSGKPLPLPISIWMTRNAGNVDANQPISMLGSLEKIYFINLAGLIPASEYPDGTGAIYRIFPFHQKVDEVNSQYPNYTTGTLGFAVRAN